MREMKKKRDSTTWSCSPTMEEEVSPEFLTYDLESPEEETEAKVDDDDEEEVEAEKDEEEPVHSVKSLEKQGLCLFRKVQRTLANSEVDYLAFLELFHCYTNGKIVKEQLESRILLLIGKNPRLIDEFKRFLFHRENFYQIAQEKAERRFREQKLDDDDERKKKESKHCSPSNWLLTKDNKMPLTSTERTESDSNKRKRCNPSPQDLWELDKYEIELQLKWFKSAWAHGCKLACGVPEDRIKVQGRIHFRRCVERLYGDCGLYVYDTFREDPGVALPVVLPRLAQRAKQLSEFNKDFDKL